jgi:hypothetical protein
MTKLLSLLALSAVSAFAQPANWTGPYRPCFNSAELKRTGHLSICVRYEIADPVVARQFHRAFDFWSKLLDADFYDEDSTSCAIAIVDGSKAVLNETGVVARAQLPDRSEFHGWIAVDPKASTYLADDEAVAIWIHEIGHLLGLKHNPSPASLMYYIDADAKSKLDAADLRALASLHAFRVDPNLAGRDSLKQILQTNAKLPGSYLVEALR